MTTPLLPTLQVVKILPAAIWIENDMFGGRHVMLQHEGCHAFAYASFGYDYAYTSNAGTLREAEALALKLGAKEPIEHRNRGFVEPTAGELREQIAALQASLNFLEGNP